MGQYDLRHSQSALKLSSIAHLRIWKNWIISKSIIEIDPISGWYLYIEASYPRRNGDYATLTSPDIRSSSAACLKFKAHMYGEYPHAMKGSLEIVKIDGNTTNTIFSKSGSQGHNWISYNADLPIGGPYKVLIYH